MRDCASSPDNFKYASDGKALGSAFRGFANDIQKLYLSK